MSKDQQIRDIIHETKQHIWNQDARIAQLENDKDKLLSKLDTAESALNMILIISNQPSVEKEASDALKLLRS